MVLGTLGIGNLLGGNIGSAVVVALSVDSTCFLGGYFRSWGWRLVWELGYACILSIGVGEWYWSWYRPY